MWGVGGGVRGEGTMGGGREEGTMGGGRGLWEGGGRKKAVTAVCNSSDAVGELQRDQSCSPVLSHTHL